MVESGLRASRWSFLPGNSRELPQDRSPVRVECATGTTYDRNRFHPIVLQRLVLLSMLQMRLRDAPRAT